MTDDESTFVPLADAMGTRAFDIALRGYERSQVDHYVDWLQEELNQARAAAARERPNYAELGHRVVRILELADEEASSMRLAAESEAAAIRTDALTATERARAEAAQIRENTQREVELLLADARAEAERVLEQARAQREEMMADSRRELNLLAQQREEITSRLTALREQLGAVVHAAGLDVATSEASEPRVPAPNSPAELADSDSPTMIINMPRDFAETPPEDPGGSSI
ncbi:MAG: DivIVA domain-containing protein [Mycobacteriales bacterium]